LFVLNLVVNENRKEEVMYQELIIWVLFGVALGYMAYRALKAVSRKNTGGCAKGCGCEADKAATQIKSTSTH
jgi:hypothetical protein